MKRLALLAVATTLACGTNPSTIPSGDFSGPTALAVTSVPDRDLLFIANQGNNEMRALSICTTPNQPTCPTNQDLQFLPAPIRVFPASILAGERPLRLAGVPLTEADNTTPHGAVLVTALGFPTPGFPGSSGAETPALLLYDAFNLVAASQSKTTAPAPQTAPQVIPLSDPPIDVVASNVPGASVTAFAVSQPSNGAPMGTITVLTVAVQSGLAQATPTRQCTVPFVPTRLALIPGSSDLAGGVPQHVYVADGTPGGTAGDVGDGLVEVSVPDIPAGGPTPCPVVNRIPASDPLDSPRRPRPLKAIAFSPPVTEFADANKRVHPGGLYLLGVTGADPALCANHSVGVCDPVVGSVPGAICVDQGVPNCGAGRIVTLKKDVGSAQFVVAAAPTPGFENASPPPPRTPAAPLRPPDLTLPSGLTVRGEAREVAFMGRPDAAACTTETTPTPSSCTSVRVGLNIGVTPVPAVRNVIGVATAADGSTYFIDVLNGRFFLDNRDADTTGVSIPLPLELLPRPPLNPQVPPGVAAPVVSVADPVVTSTNPFAPGHKQLSGWINAGVTRSSSWQVVWHPTLPGLEILSGILSRDPNNPAVITLTLPAGKDLTPWISSPELQLGATSTCTAPYPACVGDFARVLAYSPNAECADMVGGPNTTALLTDIPIVAVRAGSIDFEAVPGFEPDPSCFSSGLVGGTFQVHAGETTAGGWVVLEGLDVLTRLPHGTQLIVTGARDDYPLPAYPADAGNAPPGPVDVALSFTVTGAEPSIEGTNQVLIFSNGETLTSIRDVSNAGSPGFAGPVLAYSSPRRAKDALGTPSDELVFTAITGSNSLLYMIPAQFGLPPYLQIFY